MEITCKLFKVLTYTQPEWGRTFDESESYYISSSLEKVQEKINSEHNVTWKSEREARHYYSMDRCTKVIEIVEIEFELL